jgi:hypothetical protein
MGSLQKPGAASLLALSQTWLELSQQAGLSAFAVFNESRKLRNFWLSEMASSMDRYMRSGIFLELMRHNLNLMIRARGIYSPPPQK